MGHRGVHSTQMVSIPRDTRTEIVGKGVDDKINHAYAFGGTEMAINTVENFLDIPVDLLSKSIWKASKILWML